MDTASDLKARICEQFDYLNKDMSPLISKIESLIENGISVKEDSETITFSELGTEVTLPVEKVELHADDGEQTLLKACLMNVKHRFAGKESQPYPGSAF